MKIGLKSHFKTEQPLRTLIQNLAQHMLFVSASPADRKVNNKLRYHVTDTLLDTGRVGVMTYACSAEFSDFTVTAYEYRALHVTI